MVIPISDRNSVSFSPQSPTISSPGLEDLDSNTVSFFHTSPTHQISGEEVDEAIDVTEFPPDSLEKQVGHKELTSVEPLDAYHCLLERMKNGSLKIGATRAVGDMYGVGIRTIQRLWKRARDSGDHTFKSLKVRNCGRKRIEIDIDRIRDIPLQQRTSIRSIASALGMSRHWVCQKLREGAIRRHTNAIKPSLTQENQISRLRHCLDILDPTTVSRTPIFKNMENTIHIDEKWFFLSKRSQRYYLLNDEPEPVRSIKNSNYIPKIIFLAVVARPRYDVDGICLFDGKIGIFPLVESVAAIRSSQNRPRGTMEIKPITNITRDVMREFMIGKILPTIANKWPTDCIMESIVIQQDNTKTHIHPDDIEFVCAVEGCRLNISIVNQPPNSPDLNVLDLGFFRAIQALQSKECARSMVDLIAAVQHAYDIFSVKKSNYIFLTLQTCMNEVLKCDGGNAYKIPHIKKRKLARLNLLPTAIQCSKEVCTNAKQLVYPWIQE